MHATRGRARRLAPLLLAFCLLPPVGGPLEVHARQGDTEQGRIEALLRQGRQEIAMAQFDRARRLFQEASRLDPDDPMPHVWLGRSHFLQRGGNLDLAVRELDTALLRESRSREARYWKARVLERRNERGDMRQAQQRYQELVEEDPFFQDVLRRLQDTHVALGTLPRYLAEREAGARVDITPLNTYRWAEALRQSGALGRAEALLRGLRETQRDFLPGRVCFSLAMLLLEQGNEEDGTAFYLDAITFMTDSATAEAMWEDIYLIANLTERQRFLSAETVEERRVFLRGFWKRRDMDKTTLENERIAIHYQRLADAWRHYVLPGRRRAFNDPDDTGLLRLPPTYDVDAPFDDRGLIYLHWGEPDEYATYMGEGVPDNVSWKYEAKANRPEMIVHFEQHAMGGGWRLVAVPRPGEYAISRTELDARFGALQHGFDLHAVARLAQQANHDLQNALTRDGHVPERLEEAEALPVFTDWAFFKGSPGLSRFEFYWQIPVIDLINQRVVETQESEVRVSLSLFTRDYSREIYRISRTERLPIPRGTPVNAFAFDQEVMAVPPGTYHLAFKVEDLLGNKLQIQEVPDLEVEAFADSRLGLSTIQVASRIERGERGKFIKQGYTVVPLPSRVYELGQMIPVYFGIYGLVRDEVNATRYQISYTLEPSGGDQGTLGRISIGGLLGTRREHGGVTVVLGEQSGIFPDVHSVIHIDLGESTFRQYRLRVTVEDRVAGTVAERVTFFRVQRSR